MSKVRQKIMQMPKYSIERSWAITFCILGKLPQRMVINLSLIMVTVDRSVAQRRNHRKINPTYYSVFFLNNNNNKEIKT